KEIQYAPFTCFLSYCCNAGCSPVDRSGTRRSRHDWPPQARGASTVACTGDVFSSNGPDRVSTDWLTRTRSGGSLGSEPLYGIRTRQCAVGAIRISAWMDTGKNLGRDDGSALYAADRLRGGLDALTGSCRERTYCLRRRQERC